MVLSRFWLAIFVSSIVFVVGSWLAGSSYTLDHMLNGKKDDPIMISEQMLAQTPAFIKDSIEMPPPTP
jgi:lipopolysaccharide export LptBFGC system permease protein LptF